MSSEVEINTDQKSQEEAYHDFCCELDDPNHQITPVILCIYTITHTTVY